MAQLDGLSKKQLRRAETLAKNLLIALHETMAADLEVGRATLNLVSAKLEMNNMWESAKAIRFLRTGIYGE